eukprot:gene4659-3675_t
MPPPPDFTPSTLILGTANEIPNLPIGGGDGGGGGGISLGAGTFCIYAADLVATNGACSACTLPADPASTSATDASPATASGTAAAALPTRATAAATAARPAGTDTAPSPAGAADTAPSPTAPATVGWSSAFGIS